MYAHKLPLGNEHAFTASEPTDSVSHSPMTCDSDTKHSTYPFIKERNAEQTIHRILCKWASLYPTASCTSGRLNSPNTDNCTRANRHAYTCIPRQERASARFELVPFGWSNTGGTANPPAHKKGSVSERDFIPWSMPTVHSMPRQLQPL